MATLTGAARVAVGRDLAPFFAGTQKNAMALMTSSEMAKDPVWQLPFWDPYEDLIEPGIADLDNAPKGGAGGAITAALFLRRLCQIQTDIFTSIFLPQMSTEQPGRPLEEQRKARGRCSMPWMIWCARNG